MKKIKVLVSGAGPAGLTVGTLLRKDIFDVTLIERGPKFMNMGFSIVLWRAGYEILKKTLDTSEIKNLHEINKFSILGGDDSRVLEVTDTTKVGYSIRREDLVKQLSDRYIEVRGKNTVRFKTFIKDLTNRDEIASVTLSNNEVENFDLVIAADGMHSVIRNAHFKSKIESIPYKLTYCWIKPGSKLHNEAIIGFMENYAYLIQTVGDDALIAFYNKSNAAEDLLFFEKLKKMIKRDRGGKFELDLKSVNSFNTEQLTVEKAFTDRLVLIGDAYHGHSPTFGMGTSMALEDAFLLAELLNNVDTDSFSEALAEKLNSYVKKRKDRMRMVYATQNAIDDLIITDSARRVLLAEYLLKFGGWLILEPLLRRIFNGER